MEHTHENIIIFIRGFHGWLLTEAWALQRTMPTMSYQFIQKYHRSGRTP